jgi:acetyl esterase/lipase
LRYIKIILGVLCSCSFIFGFYIVYILFTGGLDPYSRLLGVILPQLLFHFIFIILASTILFLKLINRKKRQKTYALISLIGIYLAVMMSLPLLSTPFSISYAESEFATSFGANWENDIPSEIKKNYFLSDPFALGPAFFGWPESTCKIEKDIEYYDDGVVRLLFDVYMPLEENPDLPGNRSSIIMIHGGGWAAGNKGQGLLIMKYLAAQGYVIFDIQYGLVDVPEIREYFSVAQTDPNNIAENITIVDQIHHIGNFTKKLVSEYAATYNANINDLFIMGGSAGGHLTAVVGFGYNEASGIYSDYYNNTFADNLTINAIVPLYPPNNMREIAAGFGEGLLGVPHTSPSNIFEAFTPSELVDMNDPPALIFQGMSDGLVQPYMSEQIESAMDDAGLQCCRLLFPFAGHANEMLVSNPYGQVWLYYLERFLYLNQ